MQISNKDSWKYKLDPNFNKLVKFYVWLLDKLEAHPSEGLLPLPDELSGYLSKEPTNLEDGSFDQFKDFFEFAQKAGVSTDDAGTTFFRMAMSLHDKVGLLSWCDIMVESIPEEESRGYYYRELEAYQEYKFYLDILDFENKKSRHFLSVVMSVGLRYLFIKTDIESALKLNLDGDKEKSAHVIQTLVQVFNSMLSQVAFKTTMGDLLSNVMFDDKALFRAVTIDTSLLYNDVIKTRILKAQNDGDSKFLRKLGNAVSSTPLRVPELHGKVYAVLKTFWITGLYKLTNKELYSLLESSGLIPPAYPYGFNKFMQLYRPHFEGLNLRP